MVRKFFDVKKVENYYSLLLSLLFTIQFPILLLLFSTNVN